MSGVHGCIRMKQGCHIVRSQAEKKRLLHRLGRIASLPGQVALQNDFIELLDITIRALDFTSGLLKMAAISTLARSHP